MLLVDFVKVERFHLIVDDPPLRLEFDVHSILRETMKLAIALREVWSSDALQFPNGILDCSSRNLGIDPSKCILQSLEEQLV